jgi:polyhydroxybutyrate depolymerase
MRCKFFRVSVIVAGCVAFCVGLTGCPGGGRPGTLHKDNGIVSGGKTRTYWYYVPKGLPETPVPLVFCLHGGGGSAAQLTGETGAKSPHGVWMDVADREKFIVVFPEGTRVDGLDRWDYYWNDCRGDATTNSEADDVGFFGDLLTWFEDNFSVDTQRVYATGISNGGHMSLRLAFELSDRIAAIGAIAGANPGVCQCSGPVNPVAVLVMNGTEDPLTPWEGGTVARPQDGRGTVASTEDTVAFWVDFIGADTAPETEDREDMSARDASTVTVRTYDNGAEGTEVVLFQVNGGGHHEPSVREQYSPIWELVTGSQNHDVEAAEEIWAFFKRHTLGSV